MRGGYGAQFYIVMITLVALVTVGSHEDEMVLKSTDCILLCNRNLKDIS